MLENEINYADNTTKNSDFRCPICQESFRREAALRGHLNFHAAHQTAICGECEEEFPNSEQLQNHVQSIHLRPAIPVNSCKQCGATFKRPLELAEHMITHKKIKETLKTSHKRRKKSNVSSGRYACDQCSKTFEKKSILDRHKLIHTGERPFVCKICDKAFNQKGALMFHEAKHLPDKPHKCLLCGAGFSQRGNLRTHVKRVHPASVANVEGLMECPLCSCSFKSTQSLQVHLSKRHSENSRVVHTTVSEECQGTESRETQIPSSMSIQCVVPTHVVILAKKNPPKPAAGSTITRAAAGSNVIQRDSNGRWPCPTCSKAFTKLSDLQRHLRSHTGERPFACDLCPQRFAIRSTLEKHVRSRHLRLKSARCHICWKELSNNSTLAVHMRMHNKQWFNCDRCSTRFYSASALRRHKKQEHCEQHQTSTGETGPTAASTSQLRFQQPLLETDSGTVVQLIEKGSANDARTLPIIDQQGNMERQYSCNYCSMKFKKRSHMQEHQRSHVNDRPYVCRFGSCNRKFFTVSALRDHAQIHSAVRRRICDVCKKAFVTRRSLTRHMVVHSTKTPFICPYCGKRFKRGVLCRRHIRIHKTEAAADVSNPSDNVQLPLQPTWTLPPPAESEFVNHSHPIQEEIRPATAHVHWIGQNQLPMFTHCVESTIQPLQPAPETVQMPTSNSYSYLPPPSNFLEENRSPISSFIANWDSIGQNPMATPIVMGDYSESSAAPILMTTNNPELRTPDAIGLNITMTSDNQEQLFATSWRNYGLTDSQQNQMGITNEPLQTPVVFTNPVERQPMASTSDYGQFWKPPEKRNYPCPECGEQFERAIHVTRHVYKAHPKVNTATTASTSAQNGLGFANSASTIQVQEEEQQQQHQFVFIPEHIPTAPMQNEDPNWFGLTMEGQEFPPVQQNGKDRVCPCCGKGFRKPSDLIRHIRTHTDERPFQCECGRAFRNKSALLSHKQTHETNRATMLRCQVCNKMLASRGALKVHLRQHTNEKAVQCVQCQQYFGSAPELKHHLNIVHNATPQEEMDHGQQQQQQYPAPAMFNSGPQSAFSQVVPGRTLADSDRLALTLSSSANGGLQLSIRRLAANEEVQSFNVVAEVGILRQLVAQGLTLSIPFAYEDGTTTSVNVDPAALLDHGLREMTHLDQQQPLENVSASRIVEPATPSAYLTTFQNDEFSDRAMPTSTMEKTTTESSFIVECKICDLKFSNVQESRMHFQSPEHETAMCYSTETSGPSQLCEICGKLFSTRIRLMRHMRSHTGERPFQCTICGECFSQSNSLKKHFVAKHTTVRPYACPHCDRRFALKYNMETHVNRAHNRGPTENVVAVETEYHRQRVRTYLISL